MSDGTATSSVATVTITITNANDPPTAVADVGTTNEDTVLTVPLPGVLANDLDPDLVDTKVVVAVNGNPALVGVNFFSGKGGVLVNADGSYLYDPTSQNVLEPLGQGQSDTDTFTYTMQDAGGLISDATVTITVTGVNDVPTLDLDFDDDGGTPPTTGTGFAIPFTEGGPPQLIQDEVDAVIFDVDSPNLTALTVTLTNVLDPLQERLDVDLVTGGFDATFTKSFDETTTPGVAVLTITATTPQPLASFNTLLRRVTYQNLDAAPDASAPRTITFVVNDGVGTQRRRDVHGDHRGVNDPPTADNDSYSVNEGGTLNVPAPGVLDGDVDPEGDTPITAVLVTGPANASAFTLNPDGSFTYTHNGSETTTDSFTYQASANGQLSNIATVTITMTAVNDAPTAVDDANTTTEDAPVSAAAPGVLANDTDPDAGDTKTVSAVNGVPGNVGVPTATARGATVTLNANGSYTYNPGSVFQSLRAGQSDTDTFTYTAQDGAAAQSTPATVTITITGVNDAPAGTDASVTINEDATHVFTVANFGFTDPVDTPDDALLAVRIATLPAVGTLRLSGGAVSAGQSIPVANITAGNLVFTPALNASGTPYASFTFQVQDDGGTANGGVDLDPSANTVTLNVTAVNDAPAGTNTTVTTLEDAALA